MANAKMVTYDDEGAEGGPRLATEDRLDEALDKDEHVGRTHGQRQHHDDQVLLEFCLKHKSNLNLSSTLVLMITFHHAFFNLFVLSLLITFIHSYLRP